MRTYLVKWNDGTLSIIKAATTDILASQILYETDHGSDWHHFDDNLKCKVFEIKDFAHIGLSPVTQGGIQVIDIGEEFGELTNLKRVKLK